MLSEKEGFIMTNNQRICYVVGAMSLSPSLRPYPAPGTTSSPPTVAMTP